MAALAGNSKGASGDTPDITEKEMKTSIMNEAKAMNNMEGKDEADDILATTMPEAMRALEGIIPKGEERFDYASLHLGVGICKNKTRADVHRAFLLWSQKPDDREKDLFNVSKAFRRLSSFADYQLKMYEPYFSTPIDPEADDIKKAASLITIMVPKEVDSESGAVVWIIDMGSTDLKSFQNLEASGTSNKAIMRWFFGLMVQSLFDDAASTYGTIIVESFGGLGFGGMMKVQSAFKPIESDLNEMFYGVMPFKMKSVALLGAPWWLSALIAFMRLFISKKMSKRIKNLSDESFLAMMGGQGKLPEGFLGGTQVYEPRYPGFCDLPTQRSDEEEEDEIDEITL